MNRRFFILFVTSAAFFAAFTGLIFAVKYIDVLPIGPDGSTVGLATINGAVFEFIGVNKTFYEITDWLGIIAVAEAAAFAIYGLYCAIKRKSLLKADVQTYVLAAVYIIVIGVYVLFEKCVINYRPVLMNGFLEASFPSSHTMIVLCIAGTGMTEINRLIKNKAVKITLNVLSVLLIAVTVIGRLLSGVHWFTDIIAAMLISAAIICCFNGACGLYAVNLYRKSGGRVSGKR